MGQKGKIGKQRKDTFYKLAKEKGFRSRAAFKLIQLNRKFQFLENSRVCIDLCAAPGGWLQVCSEYMPVSSVIIGVDLYPILPIRNVITFTSDITTPECSEIIEQHLSTWKADLVLHDGAPNVGKNWLHDAYTQNVLVVNALKLACSHLRKGGCFITKIFRSSDYNSLIWAFGKLFGKVHATKPQASRSESAEIFVVCQNYICPNDIDPRFFEPSALFADISNFDEKLKKQKADLLKPLNKIKKTKALGYEDDEGFKTVTDLQFVTCVNPLDHLAQYNKIVISNEDILNHQETTDEIKECCNDLKILGRKELKQLMDWRRNLRKDLTNKLIKIINESKSAPSEENTDRISIFSDDEDETIDEYVPQCLDDIESMEELETKKDMKRAKRKEEKKAKDYKQRVSYNMVNQGDVLIEEENDLFNLRKIGGSCQLDQINDVEPDEMVESDVEPDHETTTNRKKSRKVVFAKEANIQYFDKEENYLEKEDTPSDEEPEKCNESKIEVPKSIIKQKNGHNELDSLDKNTDQGGGLLLDLEDLSTAKIAAANRFFERQDTFKDLDLEDRIETDLVERITDKQSGLKNSDEISESKSVEFDLEKFNDSSSDESSDEENEVGVSTKKLQKRLKLDADGLALASMMKSSDKTRRDIEDESWNRYVHADSDLAPKWFKEDEDKHSRRNVPVSQEMAKEYKQRLREIDAKPIKKVLEAKNRKKRKAMKKMDRVRKKVDAITSNEDITQKERINQIRTVYKNATKNKRQEVKTVVARKGLPAAKPNKGKYKMVDRRMKKDMRGRKGPTSGKRASTSGKKAPKKRNSGSFRKKQDNRSTKKGKFSKKGKSSKKAKFNK